MQRQYKLQGPSRLLLFLGLAIALASLCHAATDIEGNPCTPGAMLEGPTCSSFYMCLEGRLFNGTIKFDCPPGTYFNVAQALCLHDRRAKCPTSAPQPPAPLLASTGGGLDSSSGPPGVVPGPPGSPSSPADQPSKPPNKPLANLTQTAETVCHTYEIDKSGVYDCTETGFFPSYGDCSHFYLCLNTMACVIKGISVNCPKGYIYVPEKIICSPETKTGPCSFVQDSSSSHKLPTNIQLTKGILEKFFSAETYWDYQPFFPQDN